MNFTLFHYIINPIDQINNPSHVTLTLLMMGLIITQNLYPSLHRCHVDTVIPLPPSNELGMDPNSLIILKYPNTT